ncbi:MAG: phosphoribosyl-AMP cyclohydrolase [Pseudohongiellaceae bacterium]|jgi:phosphoribosyl-AMP cyclohydrolase
MQTQWLDVIRWDSNGLVPVIAQDFQSKDILMQAFCNREALQLSVQEGRAIYWSRSRGRLWRKGEESGHVQRLQGILLDCDGDSLIFLVEQVGGVACHTGRRSCYFHRLDAGGEWLVEGAALNAPKSIYRTAPKD